MQFDKYQQRVINASDGYHLVLAPPGCGKTELLTQRIMKAHEEGVAYEDMLCLTFTNRAARNMKERIEDVAGDECEGLYVGNIHRFCSRFLFENNLVSSTAGIIDELDQRDILDEFGFTKFNETRSFKNERIDISDVTKSAALIYQKEQGHPAGVQLNEPFLDSDVKRRTVADLARKYYSYKKENALLDFDDILLMAYTRMMKEDYRTLRFSQYHWIQVDEVQDLSPLQHGIIDKLTASDGFTVMYLGDEQQAIYSFMGAKLSTLSRLYSRAEGHIHRLHTNYRSPKYLVDTLNDYAVRELSLPAEFLPRSGNDEPLSKGSLNVFAYPSYDAMDADLPKRIKSLLAKFPDERIAILTRTNAKAEAVSQQLSISGVEHFRLSGQDVFRTDEYKAITAHFLVTQQDTANAIDWARILWQCGATRSFTDARGVMSRLRSSAMAPTDLFTREPGHSYVDDFHETYRNGELVIFDTETTGLDIFEDDIIQIAAVKVRSGQIVPGSEFNVILRTERQIPPMIGQEPNPMLPVYEQASSSGTLLEPAEGLSAFLEYVGDDEVLGHNADYDYQILRHNLLRRLDGERIESHIPVYWDSLKLIRLLVPHLRAYKLRNLLETFHLEGENSHRADDDILATKSLVDYCAALIPEKAAVRDALFRDINIRLVADHLRRYYWPVYNHTRKMLSSLGRQDSERIAFIDEMAYIYEEFRKGGIMKTLPELGYVLLFLERSVFYAEKGMPLREQVSSHLSDIRTYSQADLCDSGVIRERVYVMTIHKAKGLEFEHVLLHDAVDGIYPFFLCNSENEKKEEARLFYVGLSRARKRITVLYGGRFRTFERTLTPFMKSIMNRFSMYHPVSG